MISIIVCSQNEILFSSLTQNIGETIGVEFEIVKVRNSKSIFEAYNEGHKKSIYDLLVYLHEDVLFSTNKWGNVLIKYFAEIPDLGCVGVAGAPYKTQAPSAWWDIIEEQRITHLVQRINGKNPTVIENGWKNNESFAEVSIVDGVFMAVKKSSHLLFDESLSGFHCYDLNLAINCLQKKLKIIVTKEILLEHFSIGNVNGHWVTATHLFHKKYHKYLPLNVRVTSGIPDIEIGNYLRFIHQATSFELTSIAFYYWLKLVRYKKLSRLHFTILKSILLPQR